MRFVFDEMVGFRIACSWVITSYIISLRRLCWRSEELLGWRGQQVVWHNVWKSCTKYVYIFFLNSMNVRQWSNGVPFKFIYRCFSIPGTSENGDMVLLKEAWALEYWILYQVFANTGTCTNLWDRFRKE